MKFTLDVTLADPCEANAWDVATAIHNYLCQEDLILDVVSYDGVEPSPNQGGNARDQARVLIDLADWDRFDSPNG